MDKTNKYKLKAQNFWRNNQRLITLISLAAVLGVVVAVVNTIHYQQSSQKFQLEEPQTISNDQSASFEFPHGNPELAASTTLTLTVENTEGLGSSNALVLEVNGQEVSEITSGSTTVNIPSETLEENNVVTISKRNQGFEQQRLVEAEVTSYTNLQQITFVVLNLSGIILVFLPIGYVKYQQFRRRKMMEEDFPAFLRDIVEGTRAGMSLPQAVQNTESGSYGPLDEHIQKMSAQIEWGVPFDEVLKTFGEETGSPTIKRSTDTVIQAYQSGGNIQEVLESVGDNIRSIRRLKEERQSQLYGEMITGYIVYFIFIGILVALTTYLLPNLAAASESLGGGEMNILGGMGGGGSLQENIALYEQWFTRLVYIQAIFSGLIIGKLSEGQFKAGFKHVGILFAAGYLAVTFFL